MASRRLLLPVLAVLGCAFAPPALAQETEVPLPLASGDGAGPWADTVVSSSQGRTVTGDPVAPSRSNPAAALGVAERQSEDFGTLYSLGYRGELVLGFENPICNGTGPDFGLAAVSSQEYLNQERADVFVSNDRVTWTKVADDVDHSTNVGLPSSVSVARFVKIVDGSSDGSEQWADGYDVDGVRALRTDCASGPTSDLELTLTDDVVSPVNANTGPGDKVRMRIRNIGPDQSPEQELKVTFTSRSGQNPATPSISGAPYAVPSPCDSMGGTFGNPQVYICKVGALGPNGLSTSEFTLPQSFAYDVAIKMEVRSVGAADLNGTNDVVQRDAVVRRPTADFKLEITDPMISSLPEGSSDTLSYKATNAGPEQVQTSIIISPDNFGLAVTSISGCTSFASLPPTMGNLTPEFRCELPSLPAGASQTVSLKVTTSFPTDYNLVGRVAPESLVDDPNRADNKVTSSFTVTPAADLSTTLTGSSAFGMLGNASTRTYTGTISNAGPSSMTNTELRFIVKNMSGSITVPPGCTQATSGTIRTVQCATGTLDKDKSATRAITLNPTATGTITIQTIVYPLVRDPNTSNNASPVKTVQVRPL